MASLSFKQTKQIVQRNTLTSYNSALHVSVQHDPSSGTSYYNSFKNDQYILACNIWHINKQPKFIQLSLTEQLYAKMYVHFFLIAVIRCAL
jgi:hypothetical protein